MPAAIYTRLRSFPASALRLLSESHALWTILTLAGRNCCVQEMGLVIVFCPLSMTGPAI